MSSGSRPRILIADDHTLIAEALKRMLDEEFNVVAIVPNGHRLIEAAQEFNPDAIIVDIDMPALNGLMAAQRIKRLSPSTKVVYLTVDQDPEITTEAFRTGASAFLSKKSAASELVVALRTVLNGEIYNSAGQQSVGERQEKSQTHCRDNTSLEALTDRQCDVLQLLAEGKSMKEVAAQLNVATRTVAFHKYRLMRSLNLKSDADIVLYAIRKRIIFDSRVSR